MRQSAHVALLQASFEVLVPSPAQQMILVKALSQAAYDLQYPSGFLLKTAVFLYDEDIVEEEAWMSWREFGAASLVKVCSLFSE